MKKSILARMGLLFLLVFVMAGCGKSQELEKIGGEIILSTTTSTENSGLLEYILPDFEEKTGTKVKVVAVGTGQALQMGKDGEADVLLVHDKISEEAFVAEDHSAKRSDVMYNDFIVIGPLTDGVNPLEAYKNNVIDAFKYISENKLPFVSRGDDSGTHKMELRLWKDAGIDNLDESWYNSVGSGMGTTIGVAEEMKGFTLSDRATYLSMKDNIELGIVVENDDKLFNQYGVLVVDPTKNSNINNKGALAFEKWILSEETQKLIGEFGVKEYGQSLFIPNASK